MHSLSRFNSKRVGVIGTVKGDLHDIGKNLMSMMMEGAGSARAPVRVWL